MSQIYNVYCDESCHLENDGHLSMVLGATWCPLEKTKEISSRISEIKKKNHLNDNFEIKWTKVSPSKKINFYMDIIDYFFDDDDLHYRCLIIPDKEKIDHHNFKQTHDEWYYKMYFNTLKSILNPRNKYRIYIDIKDTRGAEKIRKLREFLHNNFYDFDRNIIERMQLVRSHESKLLQVCDLLNGAVCYLNRGLKENKGKMEIIKRIKERSGYSLNKTTLYKEEKFNIFVWSPLDS